MKKHLYKIVYMLIALLIIVLMSWFASSKINTQPKLDIDIKGMIGGRNFSEINYTDIKTDSFQNLAQKAYGTLLSSQVIDGKLLMSLENTNQLGSDFYNSNENLLQIKLAEFGFEIQKDEQTGSVQGVFIIKDGNFVSIPNDVLIKMMYKVYNK